MEHYFYKLSSGVDIFNSLNELNKYDNSTSFLMSAVGDLSKVSFKCPSNDKSIILEKKLEIISLSGYIRQDESHLHISVSDENCSVFGGHLLPGSIVLKSLDVLIGVTPCLEKKLITSSINKPASVDIYVLPNCPWSKRAIKLLETAHIKYNVHVITNYEEFKRISNQTSISTFPQIFINNRFIGGYNELSNLSVKGDLIKLIN